jgi:predicted permease
MMVIGYSLSKICLKDLFLDKMLFIFSVIKQFIIPLAGIFLIQNLISDKLLIQVFFIILATPVGSMVAMFAQGSDTESLAAKGVALTTILSIISIPLLSQLFSV